MPRLCKCGCKREAAPGRAYSPDRECQKSTARIRASIRAAEKRAKRRVQPARVARFEVYLPRTFRGEYGRFERQASLWGLKPSDAARQAIVAWTELHEQLSKQGEER